MTVESLHSLPLQLAVRRLANSLNPGPDLSPYVGSGIDYLQSRPYLPGDSIKNIDWRLTARTNKPYVKEYEAAKRINVYLVVDDSSSMRVGSIMRSKLDWAVLLSGALALAALDRMNPVAFFSCTSTEVSGRGPMRFHPSLLRQQVYLCLDRLQNQVSIVNRQSSLTITLRDVDLASTERSVIVVLTDLHEPAAIAQLKKMAHRHDVLVLRLIDPAETLPISNGFFRIQEAESDTRFTSTGRTPFVDVALDGQELRKARVDLIDLHIDRDFIPALRIFLKQRGGKR